MIKNYKLIIFDVDGTLLDTSEGLKNAVKYTINQYGFEQLPDDKINEFIGPPIQDSFSRSYGITDKEKLQEIATIFRNRYKDFELYKAEPYEGIFKLFNTLQKNDIKVAVATYKRQDYAKMIMDYFGFTKYTSTIYGADHENKLKKVDIIKKCIDEYPNIDISEALMIGDSRNDHVGAVKVGVDFLGVTYGFGFKPNINYNLENCIAMVDNVNDIYDVLGIKGE